jgi:predicted enzyme related to lactoylglutathione lyase
MKSSLHREVLSEATPMFYMLELTIPDPGALAEWYRCAFGFREVLHDPQTGFRLLQGHDLRLALKPGETGPGGVTLHFEVESLEAELQRLAQLGIEPIPPVKTSDEGYRRAKFTDPAGLTIVVFEWQTRPQRS